MSTISCITKFDPQTYLSGSQFNNGRSYRCFYQQPDGAIHAYYTNDFGAKWDGGDGAEFVPKGKAKLNTPLATVMFTDNKGTGCSRTFYFGQNNEIRVAGVNPGGLHEGRVNGGQWIAAKYSQISAYAGRNSSGPWLRVFYQAPDDSIQFIAWDSTTGDKYITGDAPFPPAKRGTALAFVAALNKGKSDEYTVRGFYQHKDLRIMEMICLNTQNHTWVQGSFINGDFKVENNSHITACVSTTSQINVYWTNHCGAFHSVTECVCIGASGTDGKWHTPKPVSVCLSSESPKILAIAHVPEKSTQTRIRCFFVGQNGRINDARRENEHWGWGGKTGGPLKWERC